MFEIVAGGATVQYDGIGLNPIEAEECFGRILFGLRGLDSSESSLMKCHG